MTAGERQELAASLRTLPLPYRVLFSCFLLTVGFGYLAALAYLFLVDVDPHQRMGMSVGEAITAKYYGSATSRLEASLRGAMSDKLPASERDEVIRWVQSGAEQSGYAAVAAILERNCYACHGAGSAVADLGSYERLRPYARRSGGPSLSVLARVSHVHLFGISIIFLLTGAIFALSGAAPAVRIAAIALPFLAIWADIGSWWITRYVPVFAYVVLAGGAVMGLALAVQILGSLWGMWVGGSPEPERLPGPP